MFPRRLFGIVFLLMFLFIVGGWIVGGIWNYQMYQDCRADGHKAYQCQAMLTNPSYVAVEDITRP
jgi:hypothetical protein